VIALFVGLPKISKAIPAPLLAVLAAVAVMQVADLGLPTVPAIESVMPTLALPRFGSVDLHALWPEALALALLASIDSLLCAVAVQTRTGGERVRTDQELVVQGFANMLSACVGGMPVAAAVVRSIAAVEAGATTRLAPVVQSAILGFVLLVLAPFVSLLPLVALGGLLLVVGARLVDVRGLVSMWKVARFEALVFVGTALGILLTDFVLGVSIGVVAALVHFARQQRAAVRTFGRARGLRFEGPLFFGSQANIEAAVRDAIDGDRVIIDVSAVSSVDYSGAMALAKALESVAKDGTRVSIYVGAHVAPALRFFLDECRAEGLEVVEQLDAVSRPSLQAALRTEDRRAGEDRRHEERRLGIHPDVSIPTT
jgi:SulP family sulfate permease